MVRNSGTSPLFVQGVSVGIEKYFMINLTGAMLKKIFSARAGIR
jgi:hypothetical protein